jgi:hypothetical protein
LSTGQHVQALGHPILLPRFRGCGAAALRTREHANREPPNGDEPRRTTKPRMISPRGPPRTHAANPLHMQGTSCARHRRARRRSRRRETAPAAARRGAYLRVSPCHVPPMTPMTALGCPSTTPPRACALAFAPQHNQASRGGEEEGSASRSPAPASVARRCRRSPPRGFPRAVLRRPPSSTCCGTRGASRGRTRRSRCSRSARA